jgi:hypothetical protein
MAAKDDASDTGVIRLENAEEFVEYSVEIVKPAIRNIFILADSLDSLWLGHEKLVQQLKLSIVKNRRIQVQLLTTDPTEAVRQNHPLLAIIRKLSRFQARVISQDLLDKQPLKKSFIVVDRRGIVYKQALNDFVGFAHFDDVQSVKRLTEEFEQYWRFSDEHADLRHILI